MECRPCSRHLQPSKFQRFSLHCAVHGLCGFLKVSARGTVRIFHKNMGSEHAPLLGRGPRQKFCTPLVRGGGVKVSAAISPRAGSGVSILCPKAAVCQKLESGNAGREANKHVREA